MTKPLSAEEIVQSFTDAFKEKITKPRIQKYQTGKKKHEIPHIWMNVDNTIFIDAVKHLINLEKYPHFAVSSGYDINDQICLVYSFSIYYGHRFKEVSINMTVSLPKSKPEIESICDIIPGALISEQEKQEMLGVIVKNIPKDKRAFVSEDFPKGMYPWRRDETKPDEKMVRNLHEVKQ